MLPYGFIHIWPNACSDWVDTSYDQLKAKQPAAARARAHGAVMKSGSNLPVPMGGFSATFAQGRGLPVTS